MIFLEQSFHCEQATPRQMDRLWAQGWRHFGTEFFRYSMAFHHGRWCSVIPLRVNLEKFVPSRSQKRILSKNRDLKVIIRDSSIDEIKEELFYRHSQRFKENIPWSIYNFLSHRPATVPCHNQEIGVYLGERLVAVSFLDIGQIATSAVYAMFDPLEAKRSLGIFTMLEAIRYSRERKCRYYYPGYAYRESSVYDYKKNFAGLEYLDWEEGWQPYAKELVRTEIATEAKTS